MYDANAAIDEVLERLQHALPELTLPRLTGLSAAAEAGVARAFEICQERVKSFA